MISSDPPSTRASVRDVFVRFLRLGAIGFGGPIAMLGYIEREFVAERKWIDSVRFHRIVAVAKLFPGPLATLTSTRVGYELAGVAGGIAAGLGQILPAFFLILLLAGTVSTLDRYPFLQPLWNGMALAAIALSFQATWKLTRPLFRGGSPYRPATLAAVIAFVAVLTFLFPRYEAVFIVASGLIALARHQWTGSRRPREVASLALCALLFWTCFRASIFTFGSGIAIVPVLKSFFIDEHHWIPASEFLRGLTLGQVTPGPLVIVATYLGFEVAGVAGAVATTIGIFLPTFVFGCWVMPRFESVMLGNPRLKSFFDGLLPAVCGAIAGAMVRLTLYTVAPEGTAHPGRIVLVAALTALALARGWGPLRLFAIGAAAAYLVG